MQLSALQYTSANSKLALSNNLPRRYWHGVPLNCGKKIDKKRKKKNKVFLQFVLDRGGVVTHPNITVANLNLYRFDWTHLSKSSNGAFLDNISKGLWSIIIAKGKISPK